MNKIKLIAIDIDGTLLSTDREVSRKNKEAIARALSKGIHVVLATGRMYSSARQFGYLLPENFCKFIRTHIFVAGNTSLYPVNYF